MLQLASATATVASGGLKFTPRVVSAIQDALTHVQSSVADTAPVNLGYNPDHIAVVRNGLVGVVTSGTSAHVFAGAPYSSAGKTGTAQAVTIGQKDKYNAAKLSEHQRDHALYMAYAPAESPKIALAVVVENAGFGAVSAAPIARRVFDYWLQGIYPSEDDIAATQKSQSSRPIGIPRTKQQVPLLSTKNSN
jgi:penicillin-binding protein 2